MRRQITSAAALCALAATLAAAGALASRPATTPEAEFIIQAVTTSKLGGFNRIPKRWYQVTRIRISTVNPGYAAAFLTPTAAGRNKMPPTNVLLAQLRSGKWALLDVDLLPCTIAPRAVLRDLHQGCIPGPGPRFVSFQVVSAVTCARGSFAPVPAIWHFIGANSISFSVDGQPLSAAAGYPPSGSGNIPVRCDGGRHEIWLFAYGAGQTQAGPYVRQVRTVIG